MRVVRLVHERYTRLRSGERDYGVVHESTEWCTRVQSGARVRVVYKMGA